MIFHRGVRVSYKAPRDKADTARLEGMWLVAH
jgi:hypothetical protein